MWLSDQNPRGPSLAGAPWRMHGARWAKTDRAGRDGRAEAERENMSNSHGDLPGGIAAGPCHRHIGTSIASYILASR